MFINHHCDVYNFDSVLPLHAPKRDRLPFVRLLMVSNIWLLIAYYNVHWHARCPFLIFPQVSTYDQVYEHQITTSSEFSVCPIRAKLERISRESLLRDVSCLLAAANALPVFSTSSQKNLQWWRFKTKAAKRTSRSLSIIMVDLLKTGLIGGAWKLIR